MIARVTTCLRDGDSLMVTVSYLDNSDPVNLREITSKQFVFGESITTQQARADIAAMGKRLNERERELSRLETNLAPGTEISV